MTSEIRTNTLTSRAGLSTVTMTDSGPMFSGITTFVDNSGFTFGVGGGTSIFTPATNVLTFGTNNTEKIRIDASGHMHGVGVITATHFYGDGSNLTGISAGTSLSGSTNNTVCTVTGANAIQGESTLTYDGNKLKFGGGSRALDNGYYDDIVIDNSDTTSGEAGGSGISIISGNASWCGLIFGDNDNHQRGYIKYSHQDEFMQLVTASGGGQVRIESGGSVGIGSCIHHLSDTDTNFGFPSNDSYILRIAGQSRIYTHSSEPIWHRRDVSAGVSTQTMLLNYNNAAGSGVALAFAPSTNYTSRHSSIEVVNEGNNNMTMRFKVTDANQNDHAIERMRIKTDGTIKIGNTSGFTSASIPLQVNNPAGAGSQMQFTDTSTGATTISRGFRVGYNGSGGQLWNFENNYVRFATNNTERLLISATGAIVTGGSTAPNQAANDGSLFLKNDATLGFLSEGGSLTFNAYYNGGWKYYTSGDAHILWGSGDGINLSMAGAGTANNAVSFSRAFQVTTTKAFHFGSQTSLTKYNDGVEGCSWYDEKKSWQQGQSGTIGWSMMYMNKIGGSDDRLIQFNSSGSNIGYISRSGSNVAFQTSSDYRLKKDVVGLPNGIERVKQLRPVAFKWIQDNSDMEGFLAHEAQEICPYAVSGTKDEVALEDHGDRKKGDMIVQAIDYGEFTPLLTAAMKELIAKVETLEQENIALRARVTNLEGN